MKKKTVLIMVLVITVVLMASCIPGDGAAGPEKPAGFFWGIWHGWIAPVSLIVSIFKDNITIYEKFNTGWWYDFGFYMAIISGFGGLSLSRKKKRKKKDD